jgi:hypothetical protein
VFAPLARISWFGKAFDGQGYRRQRDETNESGRGDDDDNDDYDVEDEKIVIDDLNSHRAQRLRTGRVSVAYDVTRIESYADLVKHNRAWQHFTQWCQSRRPVQVDAANVRRMSINDHPLPNARDHMGDKVTVVFRDWISLRTMLQQHGAASKSAWARQELAERLVMVHVLASSNRAVIMPAALTDMLKQPDADFSTVESLDPVRAWLEAQMEIHAWPLYQSNTETGLTAFYDQRTQETDLPYLLEREGLRYTKRRAKGKDALV